MNLLEIIIIVSNVILLSILTLLFFKNSYKKEIYSKNINYLTEKGVKFFEEVNSFGFEILEKYNNKYLPLISIELEGATKELQYEFFICRMLNLEANTIDAILVSYNNLKDLKSKIIDWLERE